jgi:copper chaperone
MKNHVIQVEGMSCDHCVQSITKAVKAVGGIASVRVDLEKKEVTVDCDEHQTDLKTISAKITDAGFEVVED